MKSSESESDDDRHTSTQGRQRVNEIPGAATEFSRTSSNERIMRCSVCHNTGHTKPTCPMKSVTSKSSSSSSSAAAVSRRREIADDEFDGADFDGDSDDSSESDDEERLMYESVNSESEEEDGETPTAYLESPWTLEHHNKATLAPREQWFDGVNAFKRVDSGPNVPRRLQQSPLTFFKLLFSDDIIEQFIYNTNAYAFSKKQQGWKLLTGPEFMRFLGIIIYMGVNQLPSWEMYWTDPIFQNQFVGRLMPLSRFSDILLCWHYLDSGPFNEEEIRGRNRRDPFWAVAGFVDRLAENSRKRFMPFRQLDVVEQCIPFNGRHPAKQYNKDEPNKGHLKVYTLNCALTGYMSNFYLYRGRSEVLPEGVTASNYPCWKLTEPEMYRNMWHVLVTDKYFTSMESLLEMRARQIYQLGTMRRNKLDTFAKSLVFKKNPKDKVRGDFSVYQHSNGVRLISWMDEQTVLALSAVPTKVCTVRRHTQTGATKTIKCPTILAIKNESMGGTDSFDQQQLEKLSYYWPHIRSVKWTVRVLIHFFYVALQNSHILFKLHFGLVRGDKDFDFFQFCTTLVIEMTSLPSTDQKSRASVPRGRKRPLGVHTPLHVPSKEIPGKPPRFKCKVCAICSKEAPYYCGECNVGLHILEDCSDSCWSLYHKSDEE